MDEARKIRKLLIANRGEIAVRVARTARRLGIETVAVHSEPDAGGYHVRQADSAVALGGTRAQENYLDIDKLMQAVVASGADAVHPGYGLLSEDAAFAAAVRRAGVAFVGPSEAALALLGDKLQARAVAAQHGLAYPPGTESVLPQDPEAALRQARDIGFPVLVKAAAGGGGIGMQVAETESAFETAVASCRARARAAFGDERVYLERYLRRPRHIEVQVAADRHGAVCALGDRECSAQRRHQKVIEEAPAPAAFMTDDRRQGLYRHARELLQSVGYVGLATVEFIADASAEEPELYFLEVNARLQVEHPVTELVTGHDLVEMQLRIVEGESLDTLVSKSASGGVAVEARIYAEDPARGFVPQPGRIMQLQWDDSVRVDSGYEAGDEVTPFYDPLIAKVVAHGSNRAEAIERLAAALGRSHIELRGAKGPRTTNLAFCKQLLESHAFQSGDYDTHLIDDILAAARG